MQGPTQSSAIAVGSHLLLLMPLWPHLDSWSDLELGLCDLGHEEGSNAVAVQDLGELTGERELQAAASPCSPGLGDPSLRVSPPALLCPVGHRAESPAEARSHAAGG